jgi:hypothetical protein
MSMRNVGTSSFLAVGLVAALSFGCTKKDDGSPAQGNGSAALTSPLSGSFEGVIVMHVDGKKAEAGPFDLECELKNDLLRIDVPKTMIEKEPRFGTKAWAVFRAGEKKAFFAMDPSKQAYTVDFDAAGDELKKSIPHPPTAAGMAPASKATVKRTGKKDTVAAIPCEEWEVTEGESRALVCMAEASAGWLKFPTKALPDDLALTAELLDGKHFPLRVIGFEKGQESGRVEIKKIEKKPIPDADFQIPAGYTKIDVVDMLKGLGGLAGPGRPEIAPAGAKAKTVPTKK